MQPRDVLEIIGQFEGQRLEYKASLPPPDVVARNIAAFANSAGGWLVIGVSDDDQVIGIDPEVPASGVIESAIARLHPTPQVLHEFLIVDGKWIYVVATSKKQGPPVLFGEKVYQRQADTSTKIESQQKFRSSFTENLPKSMSKLLETIKSEGNSGTAAKIAYVTQIDSLFSVASLLVSRLCPEGADKPSFFPHGRSFVRLIYSSVIDSWERYLSDVLIEVHLSDTRTLKSNSQFKAKDILNCTSMHELIRLMADQKVGGLSRGGLKDFLDYLEDTTNISLFDSPTLVTIKRFYAVRNLFTHANGIIDRKFIHLIAQPSLRIGEEYAASIDDFCAMADIMTVSVSKLDSQLKQKYGLSSDI